MTVTHSVCYSAHSSLVCRWSRHTWHQTQFIWPHGACHMFSPGVGAISGWSRPSCWLWRRWTPGPWRAPARAGCSLQCDINNRNRYLSYLSSNIWDTVNNVNWNTVSKKTVHSSCWERNILVDLRKFNTRKPGFDIPKSAFSLVKESILISTDWTFIGQSK